MRIRLLTPLAVALAVACAGGEAPQEETTTEEAAITEDAVAAVAAVAEYWETHYNMGHGSMVASQMVEDGMVWTADGGMYFGREAVEANLNAEIEAGSPQVQIEQDEAMIFGNMAVARGTYSVTATADDQTVENSGYWMSLDENIDGEWKIHGVITNLDSEDQMIQPAEGMEMPTAEESASILAERSDYYVTHFNMGHPSMVADTYTEDAIVMGSGSEAITGRDAVVERLTAMTDAGVQLTITPIGARELDDTWVAGVGTYTLETPGEGTSNGHFSALYRRNAEGVLETHWLLTATHPVGM